MTSSRSRCTATPRPSPPSQGCFPGEETVAEGGPLWALLGAGPWPALLYQTPQRAMGQYFYPIFQANKHT